MRLCASDPLCAEHHPIKDGLTLHGAACHACLFLPETSCERGNKYLDRSVLGEDVAASSDLYYWPKEQRARDSSGKLGSLHVKCVVADGRWLFLSSANLTDYAFTINMELGLVITGGDLPNRIERHFDRLVELGTLAKL